MEKISNINFQNKKEPSRYVCGSIFNYRLNFDPNNFFNLACLVKNSNLRCLENAFAAFKMRAKAAF